MISREELNLVKTKRKTTLYYAEKEYFQFVFLHAISNFADKFVFKGGTCLRICYDFERASEDLDFSTSLETQETGKLVKKCLNDFRFLGIGIEVYAEKEFEGNIRFEARLKGPLYNGSNSSTNTLKVDFKKQKAKNAVAKAVPKLFSDIPVFTIQVLGLEEILAEKIRALACRSQPRDLYDVWVLLQNNVKLNAKLIAEKLKGEKVSISSIKLPSKKAFEIDLKSLVQFLPQFEQVKQEVEKEIAKKGFLK